MSPSVHGQHPRLHPILERTLWPEHVTPYEFGVAASRALETTFDGREVLGDFLAGYMDQVNAKGKLRSASA